VDQDPEYNVLGKSGIRGRAKKTEPDEENGEVGLLDGAQNPSCPLRLLTMILGRWPRHPG